MTILGIDPGTAIVGYAVIKATLRRNSRYNVNEKPKVVDFGCILTKSSSTTGKRLEDIYISINKLIGKHKPDLISVESLYFFKNLKTVMPVSQAKGVILLSAAKNNVPVFEFTPLQVKMAVVGYGRAEKKQVQEMTKQILDLSSFDLKENNRKKDDATDALGIALCAFFKKNNAH